MKILNIFKKKIKVDVKKINFENLNMKELEQIIGGGTSNRKAGSVIMIDRDGNEV